MYKKHPENVCVLIGKGCHYATMCKVAHYSIVILHSKYKRNLKVESQNPCSWRRMKKTQTTHPNGKVHTLK